MRPRERGFAMLMVFLMAAAVALMLYSQIPRVAFETERDKELLLMDRGNQFKRAIQLYFVTFKRYPSRLEDLEATNNQRFLRRRYVDPYTGKDEWRLVHTNGVALTDSLVQAPPTANGQPQQQTATTTNQAQDINTAMVIRPSDRTLPPNSTFNNLPTSGLLGSNTTPGFDSSSRGSAGLASGNGTLPPITLTPITVGPNNGVATPPTGVQPGQPPITGMPQGIPLQSQVPQGGQLGAVNPFQPSQNGQPLPNQINGQLGFPTLGIPTSGQGTATPGGGIQGIFNPNLPNQTAANGVPNIPGTVNGLPPISVVSSQNGALPNQLPVQPGVGPPQQGGGFVPIGGQNSLPGGAGAPNQAVNMINQLLTNPTAPPAGLFTGTNANTIGGGIAGVASTYTGASILVYGDRDHFNEWEFVFQQQGVTQNGAATGTGAGNNQQSPAGTSPVGLPPGMGLPTSPQPGR